MTVEHRDDADAVGRQLVDPKIGAYAVISLRSPEPGAELVARLQELLTPEAALKLPPEIVMTSEASRRAVAHAARVAPTSMPVLLTGETGTGKEVMARLIHAWSAGRRSRLSRSTARPFPTS
jgi:transcriptional regulator with GAF, ATPase, and Fis domain